MTNLSHEKREKMINYLKELCKDRSDERAITAFNELENALEGKKYGLVWESHLEQVADELEAKIPVFTEIKESEIITDSMLSFNFILEGDNLHSLYLLEKTHKGKIDVIYIDPPYNTRNSDFIYNDKIIGLEDEYRHSKWLSFMNERLKIAKNLLSDNGVVFISIDDNEQANLKLLCDEIFYDNVETIVWNKVSEESSGRMKRTKHFRDVHEYILVCFKNKNVQFGKINQALKVQKFQTTNLAKNNNNKNGDTNRIFKITNPENGLSWEDEWKYSWEDIKILQDKKLLYFGRNGENKPRQILPTDERREVYVESIITQGSSTGGRKDLENILGPGLFDNPKPIKLIQSLIQISTHKNSVVLDFFAGSGTTGQAVLELNKKDGGSRKFILCTNNENEICENITYPRIKKVIEGYTYTGVEEDVLYKHKIEFSDFENSEELLKTIEKITTQNNEIKKDIRDGYIVLYIKKRYEDEKPGIPANLKYFKADWVERKPEEYSLSNALCKNVKTMIELQYFIDVDNVKNVLILNKDDFNNTILNPQIAAQIEGVWVNQNIAFTSSEMKQLRKYNYKYIPKEFFGEELREVGE